MHVMFSLWGLVSTATAAVARKRNRAGGMTARGVNGTLLLKVKVKVGGEKEKKSVERGQRLLFFRQTLRCV